MSSTSCTDGNARRRKIPQAWKSTVLKCFRNQSKEHKTNTIALWAEEWPHACDALKEKVKTEYVLNADGLYSGTASQEQHGFFNGNVLQLTYNGDWGLIPIEAIGNEWLSMEDICKRASQCSVVQIP